MACARQVNAIQELADGTLGSIRRAELELHLEQCSACRRLADDLTRIRNAAASLEPMAPPDRVWLQIAGRLRQEGRITAPARSAATRRLMPLALAASLLLVVGASLYLLYPRATPPDETASAGNATSNDAVQSVETEFRLAEQHLQNAINKLQEAAKADDAAIDSQIASTLQKNLEVIDQAIAESRSALGQEPQSVPARASLFEALKRKVILLQDTIALMNQMRKGDAAGAAQIVDSANKS